MQPPEPTERKPNDFDAALAGLDAALAGRERWQSLVAGTPYFEQYERGLTPGAVPETAPSPELTAASGHESSP